MRLAGLAKSLMVAAGFAMAVFPAWTESADNSIRLDTRRMSPGVQREDTLYTPGTYWDKSKEGWFWYKNELPPEEAEKEKEGEEKKPPPAPVLTKEYLDSLTVEEVSEMLEESKRVALDNITEENLYRYMYVQKYVSDKSRKFADVWQVVLLSHPELKHLRDANTSEAGRGFARKQDTQKVQMKLQDLKEEAALLYFYRKDCPYCQKQEPVIEMFVRKHGWYVKRIDIGREQSLAEVFGVDTVPDIWIMYKVDEGKPFYSRVVQGFASVPEIEKGIYFVHENLMKKKATEEIEQEGGTEGIPWEKASAR